METVKQKKAAPPRRNWITVQGYLEMLAKIAEKFNLVEKLKAYNSSIQGYGRRRARGYLNRSQERMEDRMSRGSSLMMHKSNLRRHAANRDEELETRAAERIEAINEAEQKHDTSGAVAAMSSALGRLGTSVKKAAQAVKKFGAQATTRRLGKA